MILVRNRIRDMLGGETGKVTFRKIKNKFRVSSSKNSSVCTIRILVLWEGADLKSVVVKFVTVFVTLRDSAYP